MTQQGKIKIIMLDLFKVTYNEFKLILLLLLFLLLFLYYLLKSENNDFVKVLKGKRSFKDYKLWNADNMDEIYVVIYLFLGIILALFFIIAYLIKRI